MDENQLAFLVGFIKRGGQISYSDKENTFNFQNHEDVCVGLNPFFMPALRQAMMNENYVE